MTVKLRLGLQGVYDGLAPEQFWEVHEPSIPNNAKSIQQIIKTEKKKVAQIFTRKNRHRPAHVFYIAEWYMWVAGPLKNGGQK
jgi:hypothetical protein